MRLLTTIVLFVALLLTVGSAMAASNETQLDKQWNNLSPRDKTTVMRLHQALRQMPAEERKFINERIERFIQMSPDERRKLKENNERWQKMPPEEREKSRQKYEQRRKEFEEKWRKEHPGQEPPPFAFHNPRKRNLAASTNNVSEGAEPKKQKPTQKEPKS
jgi:hypothetical protein